MLMNYLFITNNNEAVEALTKQYAEDNNLEYSELYVKIIIDTSNKKLIILSEYLDATSLLKK